MIVFDLKCSTGHVFEAWFGSSSDWEDQRARGLIECPLCGDTSVTKAVMAPAVSAKGNQRGEASPAMAGQPPAQMKMLLGMIAQLQREALKSADYVGSRFADEARAIHLGEAEQRGIYGETTAEDAKALIEEGIAVAPLLIPPAAIKTNS